MSTADPFILSLRDCRDVSIAGGKAVNLGALLHAGFPVPDGFAITTTAYRASVESFSGLAPSPGTPGEGRELSASVADAVLAAYASLGRGPVAVRSSATAEDMAGASMAGQYDTFLHVEGDEALLDAVARCWASLDSARTRAYLAQQGIDPSSVAMAVVVQRLVRAEVAGVLFTANPRTGDRDEMLVEAAWGLGEAVVSGRVQPDVLRIARADGRLLEQTIADKRVMIPATGGGEIDTPDHLRRSACVNDHQRDCLWRLGLKAVETFGGEQDIEWAAENGSIYLLQTRPITTLAETDANRRLVLETQETLRRERAAGRGPWVRHNLGETLPHPTPLTWSVMSRFMTGDGGFGRMYEMAGFHPSAACRVEGFLRLIAGRIYMDASRSAGMFFDRFPFRYDPAELRRNPDAAQLPPTIPAGSIWSRWRSNRRLRRVHHKLDREADTLDRQLREEVFPAFEEWVKRERGRDLSRLSAAELVDCWRERHRWVMDQFAPLSLLPSLVEGMLLADLRRFLAEVVWDEDVHALAATLASPSKPSLTLLADAGLHAIARGEGTVDDWLSAFGHRAAGEFDLATPRWRERPADIATMAARLAGAPDPLERHARHVEQVEARLTELRRTLADVDAVRLDDLVDRARRYLPFREDAKFHLMRGYELLRHVALEAGRRLGIGDDVFFLTEAELLEALAGAESNTELLSSSIREIISARKAATPRRSEDSPSALHRFRRHHRDRPAAKARRGGVPAGVRGVGRRRDGAGTNRPLAGRRRRPGKRVRPRLP